MLCVQNTAYFRMVRGVFDLNGSTDLVFFIQNLFNVPGYNELTSLSWITRPPPEILSCLPAGKSFPVTCSERT